jgi:hypothetical protein
MLEDFRARPRKPSHSNLVLTWPERHFRVDAAAALLSGSLELQICTPAVWRGGLGYSLQQPRSPLVIVSCFH